jgi:hypothetical protein
MSDDRRPRPDEVTSHSPVRARVLVQPGLGALWGLAAGDALGRRARADSGAAGAIDDAQAIADMFMDRGDYHDGEATRPSGRSDGLAALARTAVIGSSTPAGPRSGSRSRRRTPAATTSRRRWRALRSTERWPRRYGRARRRSISSARRWRT